VLGDWGLAITSYNHGVAGMVRARDEFGPDLARIVRYYQGTAFGFASRNFYAEFLAVRSIIRNLDTYFPEGVLLYPPLDHDLVRLTSAVPVSRLADRHGLDRETLADLNPAWTAAAIRGRAPLPAGIDVWLPHGALARSSDTSSYAQPVLLAGDDAPSGSSPASGKNDGRIVTAGLIDVGEEPMNIPPRLFAAPLPSEDIVKISGRGKVSERKQEHRVHVVRRGESPRLIATKYGVRLHKLLRLNAITQRTVLRPGQRLRIPVKYGFYP